MRLVRILILTIGIAVAISGGLPLAKRGLSVVRAAVGDSKPEVQLNVTNARPREVEESTQQSIIRDYGRAWQGMGTALANNQMGPLNENFTGFALDKLKQRVKDQQQNGLTTRVIDRGHKLDAVFYSQDGSAIEVRDTATVETQVLEGQTLIHSDEAQVHYYAVLTGAEDRWKVRVLESSEK
ncbi:MAG TPA: hypothetical protein VHN74_06825 [Candidatus Angelobacter sp.]|jgi:hypothetical protein|nr:hypothetical protein [Candidatus Angelobacter sp.]